MKKFTTNRVIIISLLATVLLFSGCKELLMPNQENANTDDQMFDDWYEYRSTAMGLYGLQQKLVEQIFILGELRGDLLSTTENADADMIEVFNFDITKENKYASPTNFFKLISASNSFVRVLQREHPGVTDLSSPVDNYDRLYGEALCMRAWAYFNAVRIYGKVPFIHESLTSIDEIDNFLNSSESYTDSVDIVYGRDGYSNDTIYNKPVTLNKQYYDEEMIIDYFTQELETKVKEVGVNHYIENNDNTWEVTIWNIHAMNALLGQMYLTRGDLAKAANYFERIIYFQSENYRYQLDNTFSNNNWRNIFGNIDNREHIYSLWFNKAYQQQNDLQRILEPRGPHEYMLKPTRQAVLYWETIWDDYTMLKNSAEPWKTKMLLYGKPGDFYRGYGVSYAYLRNGEMIPTENIREMLTLKSENNFRSASLITEGADTVVWKYSWNKNIFDEDANFILYRAAGIHLWLAEIYVYWAYEQNKIVQTSTSKALDIVNLGKNYPGQNRRQLGVRGRVGFGGVLIEDVGGTSSVDGMRAENINYVHDPFTNEVLGYIDLTGKFSKLQEYLESQIIDERARELAFEGERFYDLMRVAKRRKAPSFLAERVAKKYPEGKREEIYNKLMNEKNWYINYFEDK
jgi:starch-binding outer membrane protein, SusD/RagB family